MDPRSLHSIREEMIKERLQGRGDVLRKMQKAFREPVVKRKAAAEEIKEKIKLITEIELESKAEEERLEKVRIENRAKAEAETKVQPPTRPTRPTRPQVKPPERPIIKSQVGSQVKPKGSK